MPEWTKRRLAEISEEVFSEDYLKRFHDSHDLIETWHDAWTERYPGQYVLVVNGVLTLVTDDTTKLHKFIDRYPNVVVRKLPAVGHAPPL